MPRTVFLALCAAAACGPQLGEPTLDLTLNPRNVTDATPVKVRVLATRADGTVGTGTVKITSTSGSFTTPVDVTLDGFGSATADLICDPAVEAECAGPVRVVAEWTSDGVATSAEARLNSGAVLGGGPGGGTGGGGGSGVPLRVPFYVSEIHKSGFLLGYGFHPLVPGTRVNQPTTLVPTNSDSWSAGPNGQEYYVTTNPRIAYQALPEALGAWSIGIPFQNDMAIVSPCGTGAGDLAQFLVFPDTEEHAFVCSDPMKSTANVRMATNGARVVRLGWDKHFIALPSPIAKYELWRDGQKVKDLKWSYSGGAFQVTPLPDGFLINARCEVAKVDFAGVETVLGSYQGSPPGTGTNLPNECCRASVAEDLKGYVATFDRKVIGTCDISGTNAALFTPSSLPTQNWMGMPPVVPPSFMGLQLIVVQ